VDPTVVRSLAVTADDAVSAVEARHNGRPAVLRATPPLHGRMRARLHLATPGTEASPDGAGAWTVADPEAVHLDPRALFDDDAPGYPTPASTEDRLRASDRQFSTEAHREYHTRAVAAWRRALGCHRREAVTLRADGDDHRVRVGWLD
jgi:hypothetical protein